MIGLKFAPKVANLNRFVFGGSRAFAKEKAFQAAKPGAFLMINGGRFLSLNACYFNSFSLFY